MRAHACKSVCAICDQTSLHPGFLRKINSHCRESLRSCVIQRSISFPMQNHFIILAINLRAKYAKRVTPLSRFFRASNESLRCLVRDFARLAFGGNYRLIAGLSSIDIQPVCSINRAGIIQGKQPGGVRRSATERKRR